MTDAVRMMLVDGVVSANSVEAGEVLAAVIAGVVGACLVLGVGAFVARNRPEL